MFQRNQINVLDDKIREAIAKQSLLIERCGLLQQTLEGQEEAIKKRKQSFYKNKFLQQRIYEYQKLQKVPFWPFFRV